jgi:methionyl-tRNA formyltransferase
MGLAIVFMGTPDFARASLEALLASRHEVRAVVSQPDRARGRGQALAKPPVAELALARGLPLLQPESTGTREFRDWVKSFSPDVAVVAAFGHILGPKALAVPRFGCVNVHASLLPRWRGASPIAMAVLAGDPEAGVSIMQMDVGMDTGDVLAMRGLPVLLTDTGESLHDKLAALGGGLLVETLDALEAGQVTPARQPDVGVTTAPLLAKDDAELDWREPAVALERKIRAFHPWPGTRTAFAAAPLGASHPLLGKVLRVLPTAEVCAASAAEPGTILEAARDRLVVACGEGALALHTVQLEGKKALPTRSFLVGVPSLLGLRLGRA